MSSKKSMRFEAKLEHTEGREELRVRVPVCLDLVRVPVLRASLSLEKRLSTKSGCMCPASLEMSSRKLRTSSSQRIMIRSFSSSSIFLLQGSKPFSSKQDSIPVMCITSCPSLSPSKCERPCLSHCTGSVVAGFFFCFLASQPASKIAAIRITVNFMPSGFGCRNSLWILRPLITVG